MAPSLTTCSTGVLLSWLTPPDAETGARSLMYSMRAPGTQTTWSPPKAITTRANFFANWADVPRVAEGADGTAWATWLQVSGPGTYAYDIGTARAHDLQAPWVEHGTLNDDRVLGEHGFVSLVPDAGGLRAFWLDGRAMTGEGHAGHGGGDMTLRTAMLTDTIGTSTVLDTRVCECCPTGATVLPLGPAVVARDRGPEEERDIAIVRLVEGSWMQPKPVSADAWRINGCPVNGPRIEADGATVAVAWFSGGGEHPGLNIAWSIDGGTNFNPPITLDNTGAAGHPAMALIDGGALIAWLDDLGEDQWLKVRFVGIDGRIGPIEHLAQVPAGRRAGVPQMATLGKHVLVTWVAADHKKGLDALLLPISTFPRP